MNGTHQCDYVVMSCPAMAPLVDRLRDAIEAELASVVPPPQLLAAADAWRDSGAPPPPPPAQALQRWPILSGWRWLVSIPAREAVLSADVNGSSAASAAREVGADLAYRCTLPRSLGQAICKLSSQELADLEEQDMESYWTLRQHAQLQSELSRLSAHRKRVLPAILLSQRLALGLRFI